MNKPINPMVQVIVDVAKHDQRLSAEDRELLVKAPQWIANARDLLNWEDLASYAGLVGATPGTLVKNALRDDMPAEEFAAKIKQFLEG